VSLGPVMSSDEEETPMQFLERDAFRLAYEEAGHGAPPILLVHGWCENAGQMRPLLEHFRRARRVVSVDLRGHGESDVPESDCSLAQFADDLAWMAGELGVHKPVVVGHSMGGAVVLELASRSPDVTAAVVAIEGTIIFPPETRTQATPMVAAQTAPLAGAAQLVLHRQHRQAKRPSREAVCGVMLAS
jgi:pimeloyl-ACP methyl ester carboxylesterase